MGACCGCVGSRQPNQSKYTDTNKQPELPTKLEKSYATQMQGSTTNSIQESISLTHISIAVNALKPQTTTTRTVRLTLSNGLKQSLTVSNNTNISGLKQLIYENYNILRPELIVLQLDQRVLQNYQVLTQIRNNLNGQIHITERKAEIWEIGLKCNRKKIDPISAQMGVVQLQCKHQISREGLKGAIQHQTEVLKQEFVQCPQLGRDGNICRRKINCLQLQLIGGYTQHEWNKVAEKISMNYLLKYTATCPKSGCRVSIDKNGLTVKKNSCPMCSTSFCFECSQIWAGENNSECKSAQCLMISNMIQNAPWDRTFVMNGAPDPVKVPNLRACPKCKQLIKNTAECKQTKCLCGCHFCFVCLSVNQNGWRCGSYDDYCPTGVAPNQKLEFLTKPT